MIWLTRYLEESIKGEDLVNTKKIAIKYWIQRIQSSIKRFHRGKLKKWVLSKNELNIENGILDIYGPYNMGSCKK